MQLTCYHRVDAKHATGNSTIKGLRNGGAHRLRARVTLFVATFVLFNVGSNPRFLDVTSAIVAGTTSDLAAQTTNYFFENRPQPKSAQPQKQEQAGACLITMDDNHWLTEWIAYHYFTMNLRHLLVVVDPQSLTSPQSIFARWDGLIQIDFWNDDMIFHGINQTTQDPGNPGTARYQHHKERQLIFYQKCLQTFQEKGTVDWVMTTDIDEFITLRPRNSPTAQSDPNYHVPTLNEPGSILRFLNDVRNSTTLEFDPACVPLPRRQYGAIESSPQQVQEFVPQPFQGSNFLTLRWRHFSDDAILLKTIVDVSRANLHNFQYGHVNKPSLSCHNPIPECMPMQSVPLDKADVVSSHYIGTPEQFMFRQDCRRKSNAAGMKSRARYDNVATLGDRVDDSHRLWLQGFVKMVGRSQAESLLLDAGKLSSATTKTG